MAFNEAGQPICHFCKEVVYDDEFDGSFYQWASGWIRRWSWPTTSNHAKDVRWTDQYAHKTCLDAWLRSKKAMETEVEEDEA